MFTNTPDHHFILDRHPAYPKISIAAGFSGHGYITSATLLHPERSEEPSAGMARVRR